MKAYALDLDEVRIILANNKNITTLADPAKALSNKKQENDRKATEKFHAVKKKWEDFDKPLEFQAYYDERMEQKVKEIRQNL